MPIDSEDKRRSAPVHISATVYHVPDGDRAHDFDEGPQPGRRGGAWLILRTRRRARGFGDRCVRFLWTADRTRVSFS